MGLQRVGHNWSNWAHTHWRGEKTCVPSWRQSGKELFPYSDFLACSGLQLAGWGPWTLGKAIWFTQSTDSNVHLIQKQSHRYTRIMFDQLSVHPMAQSGWSIKLTITMSACVARHVQILLVRTCRISTSWLQEGLGNSRNECAGTGNELASGNTWHGTLMLVRSKLPAHLHQQLVQEILDPVFDICMNFCKFYWKKNKNLL